jgi:hypothetical protein
MHFLRTRSIATRDQIFKNIARTENNNDNFTNELIIEKAYVFFRVSIKATNSYNQFVFQLFCYVV